MYERGAASLPLSKEFIVIDGRDLGDELAESLADEAYGDGDGSCNVEEYDSSEGEEISRDVRRRLRDECEDGDAGGDRERPEDTSLACRSCRLSYGWDEEATGE